MSNELATAISTIVISATVSYLLAVRQVRHQLNGDLQKASESIKQQLQADMQKEYSSRFNERKWETYEHFANIISRLMKNVGNKQLQQKQSKIIEELYDFTGKLWIVGGDNVIEAFNNWRKSAPNENADINRVDANRDRNEKRLGLRI